MENKLDEILKELIKNCIYRKNVSPNNFELYKKELIDNTKQEIIELIEKKLKEKIHSPYPDSRGISGIVYWENIEKILQELKAR